jgi:hypothetical protein
MANRPVRIANCSGFYGDRLSAAAQLLGGHESVDVLTGDWLAELTMSILAKSRARGRAGYATTFVTQMERVLGRCHGRGVKVVTNAGGIDPHGCADRVRQIADRLGIAVSVAVVDGDDLTDRLDELRSAGELFRHLDTGESWTEDSHDVVAANAYLGGHAITAALRADADVVIPDASPMPPWSPASRRGGTGGHPTTSTPWPEPPSPVTPSNAELRSPGAISRSSGTSRTSPT